MKEKLLFGAIGILSKRETVRRTLLVSGALLALQSGLVMAQGGKIDLYADATMSNCELVDDGAGVRSVHVFFTGPEVYGVGIYVPVPACWPGTQWHGDILQEEWIHIGLSNDVYGLSVAFGACLQPPVHVAEIRYLTTGTASTCCELRALPPITDFYVDCSYQSHEWEPGQSVVINPDDTCPCQQPLAVESTTWGRVKSLYR